MERNDCCQLGWQRKEPEARSHTSLARIYPMKGGGFPGFDHRPRQRQSAAPIGGLDSIGHKTELANEQALDLGALVHHLLIMERYGHEVNPVTTRLDVRSQKRGQIFRRSVGGIGLEFLEVDSIKILHPVPDT